MGRRTTTDVEVVADRSETSAHLGSLNVRRENRAATRPKPSRHESAIAGDELVDREATSFRQSRHRGRVSTSGKMFTRSARLLRRERFERAPVRMKTARYADAIAAFADSLRLKTRLKPRSVRRERNLSGRFDPGPGLMLANTRLSMPPLRTSLAARSAARRPRRQRTRSARCRHCCANGRSPTVSAVFAAASIALLFGLAAARASNAARASAGRPVSM